MITDKNKIIKDLKKLIKSYKTHNDKATLLTKQTGEEKSKIKKIMLSEKIEEIEVGKIFASCKVSERSSFDEELLISTLKKLKVKGVIKKREYVDNDALEDLIYNGKLDASKLAKCEITKAVTTLRIKEKKDGSKEKDKNSI